MAEGTPAVVHTPNSVGHGIGGWIHGSTAGLPNWAWILVIGGGLVAAIIIPKIIAAKTGSASTSPTTTGNDATNGIGLAVDPTTGLPYAVSGLVPSGAYAGGSTPTTPAPAPATAPTQPLSWLGQIPLNSVVSPGGFNPDGTQRFWFRPAGGVQTEFDMPKGSTVYAGAGGRWWYKLPGGTQQALTNDNATATYQPMGNNAPAPAVTTPGWPGGTTQVHLQ